MYDLSPPALYSIGHSNMEMEEFVELLGEHRIKVLADVRSYPYSSYSPQFNKRDLRGKLGKEGIRYVFLGEELGAYEEHSMRYVKGSETRVPTPKPSGRSARVPPWYLKRAETQAFQDGLEELWKMAQSARTVMMCSEEQPYRCHRFRLVTWKLYEQGRPVKHILRDCVLETEEVDSFKKLREFWEQPPQQSLFG